MRSWAAATMASMTTCASTPLASATSAIVCPSRSGFAQLVLLDPDGGRRGLEPDARAEVPAEPARPAALAGSTPGLRTGGVERLVDGVGLGLGDRAVGDEAAERLAHPVTVVLLGNGAQRSGEQDPCAEGGGAAHPESVPAVHRRVLSSVLPTMVTS